jgi:hypothetical protein
MSRSLDSNASMAYADVPPDDLDSCGVVSESDTSIRHDGAPGTNRRIHRRLTPREIEWLRTARVKYGAKVRLIDVSAGGIAIETDQPLKPDATIVFELAGPEGAILVPARVLRSQIVSLEGGGRYRTACVFKRQLDLMQTFGQPATEARIESQDTSNTGDVPTSIDPPTSVNGILRMDTQKVVVRYRDGRMLKGFSCDFSSGQVHLRLASEDHEGHSLIVPLNQLKAIFFVREFEGDPAYDEQKTFADPPKGRKLEVTFDDDEVLVGSTLSYSPEACGFFLHPADRNGNNIRIYVSAAAVRHVRFLPRK